MPNLLAMLISQAMWKRFNTKRRMIRIFLVATGVIGALAAVMAALGKWVMEK
jgi:hypothetical protein